MAVNDDARGIELDITVPTLIGLGFAVVGYCYFGYVKVNKGWEYTIENFGRYQKVLKPGKYILIPLFQRVGRKIEVQRRFCSVPSTSCITSDSVVVDISGAVFFEVEDTIRAAYAVTDLDGKVANMAAINIREIIERYTIEDLRPPWSNVEKKICRRMEKESKKIGVKIVNLLLRDCDPSESFKKAMKEENEAKKEKQGILFRAQIESELEVIKARTRKEVLILEKEGAVAAAERMKEMEEGINNVLYNISITGDNNMSTTKNTAKNSAGVVQGSDNSSVSIVNSDINIGLNDRERNTITAKLDTLISMIDGSPELEQASRQMKNIKDELHEETPDKTLISKYLEKAKGVFATLEKSGELFDKAKDAYEALGSALP